MSGLPRELLELKLEGSRPAPQELRLLRLLSKGYTERGAARVMGKSAHTVSAQMKVVRARLVAETAAHAVAIALREGIIE
jgi:DNA-binding CsgD family transcriptional regulator